MNGNINKPTEVVDNKPADGFKDKVEKLSDEALVAAIEATILEYHERIKNSGEVPSVSWEDGELVIDDSIANRFRLAVNLDCDGKTI